MKRDFFSMLIFVAVMGCAYSQQKQMVASCSADEDKGAVLLKWFGKKVVFNNGVYLYRVHPASGERVKLNSKPIKRGAFPLTEKAFKEDSALEKYVALLDKNSSDLKDLLAVFVMLKALESNEYARYAGLFFEDTATVKGEEYYYELFDAGSLVNSSASIDGSVRAGVSNLITAGNYSVGKSPDSLTVEAHDSRVSLKWTLDEYSYWGVHVERAEVNVADTEFITLTSRPVLISPVQKQDGGAGLPEKFYEDKTVQNGKTYLYRIVGLDYFNRKTLYSQVVMAQPRDETPPAPPQNLRSQIGLYDITLTWENAFKSDDLLGYCVYRKKGRSKDYERITNVLLAPNKNVFFDTVPEHGTYTYVVASVDLSGNEARSFETTKELPDIFPPSVPVLREPKTDTGKIILQWSAANEKDLLGYRIYRTVTSDKNSHYVLINSTPIKDTFFTDMLPRNAKNKFCYKIASVDTLFNMSDYSNVECVKMPDVTPPEQPVIKYIYADSSSRKPLVTWLANAEPDLLFYRLHRSSVNQSVQSDTAYNIPSTQNIFKDISAVEGVQYRYMLTACDSSQNISIPSKQYLFRLTKSTKK
ncbi:MAG: hypothetical protein LBF01_00605 [Bacteroidales bacterium]|jgi:fibronectin type 3 domain-containing protein|nr:hypothetical protein [Bacteroidales bacterium]